MNVRERTEIHFSRQNWKRLPSTKWMWWEIWEFELIPWHQQQLFVKMTFLDDWSDESPRSEAEFQRGRVSTKLRMMKRKAANVKRGHEPSAFSKSVSFFTSLEAALRHTVSEKSKFSFLIISPKKIWLSDWWVNN